MQIWSAEIKELESLYTSINKPKKINDLLGLKLWNARFSI